MINKNDLQYAYTTDIQINKVLNTIISDYLKTIQKYNFYWHQFLYSKKGTT